MSKTTLVALLLGISACSGEPAAPAQPASAPAPTTTTPEPAAAPALERGEPPTMRTLAGALSDEAARRPTNTLRAETVFAALDAAGLAVTSPRQYLGMTARADYCAGGTTADGLAVAICEYDSAADAAAGRLYVERRYAAVSSFREIHVHGATTLTLTFPPERPLGALARQAATTFTGL